ncbi:ATP-binding cassette domain-containing protein [Cohnella sp.]|uniref:ATP-binding cassette domain-containing protein n=1 Tax=Cohnella sp. TaxID=1883426 RepID=UPI003562745F
MKWIIMIMKEGLMSETLTRDETSGEAPADNGQKPPIICAKGLKRIFGRGSGAVAVLKGIDMAIPPGTLVALKGRSGSGKTTLLNLLGALDRPTEGSVRFAGREISTLSDSERDQIRRTEIGLVFQSIAFRGACRTGTGSRRVFGLAC